MLGLLLARVRVLLRFHDGMLQVKLFVYLILIIVVTVFVVCSYPSRLVLYYLIEVVLFVLNLRAF